MIESMNRGAFLSLTGDEAYKTLGKLSDNSLEWDFRVVGINLPESPKEEASMRLRIVI
jgi:hypothetical protein